MRPDLSRGIPFPEPFLQTGKRVKWRRKIAAPDIDMVDEPIGTGKFFLYVDAATEYSARLQYAPCLSKSLFFIGKYMESIQG